MISVNFCLELRATVRIEALRLSGLAFLELRQKALIGKSEPNTLSLGLQAVA
jgi:hypothetical protein